MAIEFKEGKEMESHSENINMISCPVCSQGNEKRARFCVHCGNPLPRRRKVWRKKRHILFGAIGLILAGAFGYLLAGGI
jgi:predicted nucleic acid-binding Zn ribbon protein